MKIQKIANSIINPLWSMTISNYMFQTGKNHIETCSYIGHCYRYRQVNKKQPNS
ncbi:hypothetical protein VMF7928_00927 [Vibrio marisflavi CECT 7928]|uniref:Uncharacterized protein n=1 Tax=Vibrio marisflavi CECT 7928 TaxID=634439 RepID=A0ABM9A0Q4_9VIBR|nr:hypothetical protein VMF7928_00927 [Vibrio marisflavi CECT 7928]